MKSKAPLLLMEQMIMLLVFAFAAALCLQAFVKSDNISRRSEARDRALQEAQSAAEVIRHAKGDLEQAAELLGVERYTETSLMLDYDRDWNPARDAMRYSLIIVLQDSGVPGLGKAQIRVWDESAQEQEAELLRFDVMWQEEVDGDGR